MASFLLGLGDAYLKPLCASSSTVVDSPCSEQISSALKRERDAVGVRFFQCFQCFIMFYNCFFFQLFVLLTSCVFVLAVTDVITCT